jgi:hypothetical protein
MSFPIHDKATSTVESPTETPVVMTLSQKRFYASDDCVTARMALQNLVDNPKYNTEASYYSGNDRTFVERHLYHLSTHPTTNLLGYISNLKLMTSSRERA